MNAVTGTRSVLIRHGRCSRTVRKRIIASRLPVRPPFRGCCVTGAGYLPPWITVLPHKHIRGNCGCNTNTGNRHKGGTEGVPNFGVETNTIFFGSDLLKIKMKYHHSTRKYKLINITSQAMCGTGYKNKAPYNQNTRQKSRLHR